jgi:hypothetical protein
MIRHLNRITSVRASQSRKPHGRFTNPSIGGSALRAAFRACLVVLALRLIASAAAAQDAGSFSVLNNVVLRDGQAWLSGDQVALLEAQKDPSLDWGQQVSAVSVSPDRRVVAITLVGANHGWVGLLDVSSKSLVDSVLILGGGIRHAVWSGGSQYLALETSDATGLSGVVVWSREGWTARVGNVILLASAATSIEHPEWTSEDSLSVVVDGAREKSRTDFGKRGLCAAIPRCYLDTSSSGQL